MSPWMMPRTKRKGVDLMPIFGIEQTTLDGLASNVQATLLNATIENVNTSEDYGSGSIKGLFLDVMIKPEAVIEIPPHIVVSIYPSGMSVPDLGTGALLKANERFMWGTLVLQTATDPAATNLWQGHLNLKTARRFHSGDKLTIVMENNDPNVAFGAAAVGFIFGRAYVSED